MPLGFPPICPYLKDYRPKGYRDSAQDLNMPEVERLAEFMPLHLTPNEITALRARYRQRIRHKRKAARFLGWKEQDYRERLNRAIRKISERF
jgi:hypothetical protein